MEYNEMPINVDYYIFIIAIIIIIVKNTKNYIPPGIIKC